MGVTLDLPRRGRQGAAAVVAGLGPAPTAIGTSAVARWYRHDVSILMVGVWLGWQPASNVSMTIMRPPQQGHGRTD